MTLETLISSVAASGPMAALLLYALYYQTKRAEKAEAKVESLYERVLKTMTNATKQGDSNDGTA